MPDANYEKARAEILRRGLRTRTLDLTRRGLTALPPEIARLTALQSLNLRGNLRIALPPEIARLTALKSINLSSNLLTTLPLEITHLTALESLELGDNQLITLPPEIIRLTALQSLSLNGNLLTTLPPDIARLTALESLDLSSNLLTTLPLEITHLTALESLDLGDNQLITLPPEIIRLTALESLDLSGNQLATLPPEIAGLTALQNLNLSDNRLAALPSEISRLSALQDLDLSDNQLTALPPEITRLPALQSLSLANNQLAALPSEMARLTSLQRLSLNRNRLTTLPPGIGTLTSLEHAARTRVPYARYFGLHLGRNPLPAPYPTLIAPGQPEATSNVLAYLRGELPEKPPVPPEPPPVPPLTIPPSLPAAIRVAIVSDKLTLDPTPSPADMAEAPLAAAITALKSTMADLLEDAAADPSDFDRRPLTSLRRALERMPGMPMPTSALFELAHLYEITGKHAALVAEQWPDALVAHFTVVLQNLGRVLGHFQEWEDFKQAAAKTTLTPEQAQATPAIARDLAAELRAEDSQKAVEETIPAALDRLADLRALTGDEALDLLAPDILESISNVLKPVAEFAMQANPVGGGTIGRGARRFGREARKSVERAMGEAGKQFGPWLIKWARRVLSTGKWGTGLAAGTVGTSPVAAFLVKAYPQTFGWLEPILALLPRLL